MTRKTNGSGSSEKFWPEGRCGAARPVDLPEAGQGLTVTQHGPACAVLCCVERTSAARELCRLCGGGGGTTLSPSGSPVVH